MENIYEQPVTTNNQLLDVISWLKQGKTIVVLSDDYGKFRLFHGEESNELVKNMSEFRVIIVRCSSLPGLLDDGEWDYYILGAGNKEYNSIKIVEEINSSLKEKAKNIFYFVS
jgi:hypothetical protein